MRARIAASAAPSVTAGSTRCAGVPRPPTGNQPSSTAKTIASRGPSQKFGTDMPTRDSVIAPKSIAVPRQTAATIPAVRDRHCHEHRSKRQLSGCRHALENLLCDRLIVAQGHTEIAMQQTLKKRAVLNQERPVESQTLAQLVHFFRRRAFAQHGGGGITRNEVDECEHERGYADQDRNGQHEPSDEVLKHRDEDAASALRGPDG